VILLNGWPGDRRDYDALVRLLVNEADVIVPDLRGFGESDKHQADAEEIYSGRRQANGVIALLEELAIKGAVIGGYDVGSFVAQTVARIRPDLVRAMVVSPPLPGAGKRVLELKEAKEFWCATFHQLTLAAELVDGKPEAVRAYLRHFWEHWSGPTYVVDESRLDHLAEMYSKPGAFTASMMWYRASGIRLRLMPRKSRQNDRTACHANHNPMAGTRSDFPYSVVRSPGRFFYRLQV